MLLHAHHLERAANLQRVRSPHALGVVVTPLVAVTDHHVVDGLVRLFCAGLSFLQEQNKEVTRLLENLEEERDEALAQVRVASDVK